MLIRHFPLLIENLFPNFNLQKGCLNLRFGGEIGSYYITGLSKALNIGSYEKGHALDLLESQFPLLHVWSGLL